MSEEIVNTPNDTSLNDTSFLVFHGSWFDEHFFLWAESAEARSRPRGRQTKLPPHPHAATPDALRARLVKFLPASNWAALPELTYGIFLPTRNNTPILPPWLMMEAMEDADDATRDEAPVGLGAWKVTGLALDVLTALDLLIALPGTPGNQHSRQWGDDLHYWSAVAKFGLETLARQAYLPGLTEHEGHYRALWLPVWDAPSDRARLKVLTEALPPVARALFEIKSPPDPALASSPHTLLENFLKQLVDIAVRDWGHTHLDARRRPPTGIAGLWWSALWAPEGSILATAKERRELATLYEVWQAWIAQLQGSAKAPFRLSFRLEPPEIDQETGKISRPDWRVHYLLQANDDPSLLVPVEQVWAARGGTLEYLSYRFENAQEHVLASLGLAARLFPPIKQSLRTARPQACILSADEAFAFLREVGPLLESSGFGVLVPPWWNKPNARLTVRAQMKAEGNLSGKGILNRDALISFNWELALGDEALSREEFERLVALKMPLVQVRGQWVLLQPQEIEAAIAFWKKQQQQVGFIEALALAQGATTELNGLPVSGVQATGWLAELLQQLRDGEKVIEVPQPGSFVGQLRPYQQRGTSWLASMRHWGLGACLADDMGLGKTIQTIALLLHERERETAKPGPALLVCPTSVVGNWKREVQRFGPSLKALVHHGAERERGADLLEAITAHDLIISTYGLVRRDVDTLAKVDWDTIILDEAQNIKNPHAKQTQTVRQLRARQRIALTGTPVENRLSELWSIMQFLNPGLLGSQSGFRERFALPIERYQDAEAATRLRGMVGPFILRRLKTDPTIIQDLPDKIEIKTYCSLTPEQITLYQAVVEATLNQAEAAETEGKSEFSRRGAILSALLRLKQVCNHPAHYLGDGSALPGRSGKLDRLTEMLEEVLDMGERALIFTQFAEMGQRLQHYLQALFGVETLYLHGGTTPKQRDKMVARFQNQEGPPLFVLSLKAGGVGLNLTSANHVFHFDRWWNPAVEDQATDRAFRIGQRRDVQVHKLICEGTLEERIDALIESKKALAQSVVGAGEDWLTGLSTEELREIITLRET